MIVLVVGAGGREHALVWKLLQSPEVSQVYCAPGNAGISLLPRCHIVPLAATDIKGLVRFASVQGVGLTVVGPEVPLAAGIVDAFRAEGLTIFGPTQAGAQIEASKSWAKNLMHQFGIPTAAAVVFQERQAAQEYVLSQSLPVVIKADGLAAGKGVTVATTHEEAVQAVAEAFALGGTVLVEQFLPGEEVSVLALCDGHRCVPLLPAQDHKRLGEGDTGPNTGGMGAYAPATHLITPERLAQIQQRILDPTLAALQNIGIDYRGVLYAGLMISPEGDPYVVEFNCRFGDPETQVIVPLLQGSLAEILLACAQGCLDPETITWQEQAAACVVLASAGYPGSYEKGLPIQGLAAAANTGALVFHAGTRWSGPARSGQLLTDGGRVLCITGLGKSIPAALDQAYAAAACIQFPGVYYRRDIGHRVK
ncbi:MAG: phosphoribosylamine--glycine ligase [Thermostichales cyanobacterium HHBFW_bins_127]